MTNHWLDKDVLIVIFKFKHLAPWYFKIGKATDFDSNDENPKQYRYYEKDKLCNFQVFEEDHRKIQQAFADGLKELVLIDDWSNGGFPPDDEYSMMQW